MLAEVHEMITRKVAKIIGLQQREMEILLKAVGSPEQNAPQGVSQKKVFLQKALLTRMDLNAALEARKLYIKNRKEEAMAVLGLAIYFSQELISGGVWDIPFEKEGIFSQGSGGSHLREERQGMHRELQAIPGLHPERDRKVDGEEGG